MSTPQAQASLPFLSLWTGLVACSAVGAAVATGLGVAGGWGVGPELAKAAVFGAACLVAAGGLAFAFLMLICQGDATRFAMALVTCSSGRMLAGLGIAFVLATGLGLERRTFWAGFLTSAVLVLVYETVVGVQANRRMFSGPTPATGEP